MPPPARVIIQGLVATLLYSSYRYFSPSGPTTSSDTLRTTGSLPSTQTHPDGRTTISRRTVAVADLHGDLAHALNVLSMANLISTPSSSSAVSEVKWIGGHDQLVSTGDIVDRGDDTIALYQLFISLRSQSKAVGGEVRQCLGNHEFMNALGDWRYVTPGDVKSFGGVEARRRAMSIDGWIGKDWLSAYNVTQTVSLLPPLHPDLPEGYVPPKVSFVHGGITPQYASLGIDYINSVGQSFLHKALSSPHPTSWLPPNTTTEEEHLWSENGPLWYRGYATDPTPLACENAERTTSIMDVQHLVMGHTPNMDGFVTRCNNHIILIDTGISRAYGGQQSALIIDLDLIPLVTGSAAKTKWLQRQTITALYRGRLPKILAKTESELWL